MAFDGKDAPRATEAETAQSPTNGIESASHEGGETTPTGAADAGVGTGIPRAFGARVLRREDARMVTGRGHYVGDVTPPRTLYAAFARSPHAHARLLGLDTTAAKALPGVAAVLTAADLAEVARPLRARSGAPSYQECDTPILVAEKACVVGEPYALVIAESRYVAEDAAELVDAAWEPLRPVLSIDDALAKDAAPIHDEVHGNLFNHFETSTGDVDGAFGAADEVIEFEFTQQRYCAAPLEQRVAIASYDPADQALTAWLSTQVPHLARTGLALHLGMPENRVRVLSPDIGGGFGAKCVLYPEDVAIAAASKLLGRPVKWKSDRVEDFLATTHGREQISKIRLAATAEGKVTAITADLYASNGAYAPWPFTAALESGQASENVTGPYAIDCYRRNVNAVVTNKSTMGPYRGVGRVIACMSMERAMDELAKRLKLDPLEVRRRNLIASFPHKTAAGLQIESGDFQRMIDTLETAMDWKAVRQRDAALRAEGRIRGTGVAFALEQSAYGAQALASRKLELTPGYDSASVRMEPDGRVRVAVGSHNHGQGHETTFAQIVADELGIAPEDVQVVFGDTDAAPYGMGTWGSRSTVTAGGAAILASRELRQQLLDLAADMLEANAADLLVASGRIELRGSRSRGVSIREVAKRANFEPHLLPDGVEPGLEVTKRYKPPEPGSFSSSAHGAHVEVDPDTGAVHVLRYIVVEDCGTIVNPMIVDGQVQGGVAQGVGGALYECLVYGEDGNLLTTSFMDYLLPGAPEVPAVEVLHQSSPSPYVPGGIKGMGEGGAVNSPAAIVAAINDALAPFGVVANHTPLTPEWILDSVAASGHVAENDNDNQRGRRA